MTSQVLVVIFVLLPVLALGADDVLFTSPPLLVKPTAVRDIPPILDNSISKSSGPVESADLPKVLPLQRNNVSTIAVAPELSLLTSPMVTDAPTTPAVPDLLPSSALPDPPPSPAVLDAPTSPTVPERSTHAPFPDSSSSPTTTILETRDAFTQPSNFYPTTEQPVLRNRIPQFVRKLLPDRNTCGFQNPGRRAAAAPISTIDEFPWVALLRYGYGYGLDAGFRCGGTLISDRYVVTAALCVVTDSDQLYLQSVRLGDWAISTLKDCVYDYYKEECADEAVEVAIEKTIPHPGYDASCGRNDIALIHLKQKVDFTVFIRPICLPVQNLRQPRVDTILTTSGWGATRYGFQSDIKSKICVPVLSNDRCNAFYNYGSLFEDQVCVGRRTRDDFCTVDTGGPLMATDDENKPQWYLEGVSSAGFSCGRSAVPGVYTRVTHHVNWILDAIAKDNL